MPRTTRGWRTRSTALNVARGDYDNDGRPDVVLLRGGWEKPVRLSLLHNRGRGRFEDVTEASGLAEPIATESAAWGDYDNDGRLDLFVCGEYLPPPDPTTGAPGGGSPTPGIIAGSTTTGATAPSSTSPRRPASATIGGPRDPPGATTITTAGSTSSSPT